LFFFLLVVGVVTGLRIVHPHERLAVYRDGRFSRLIEPGLHWRVPFTASAERLDLDKVLPHWRELDAGEIRRLLTAQLESGASQGGSQKRVD